jgi:hypothetical protein
MPCPAPVQPLFRPLFPLGGQRGGRRPAIGSDMVFLLNQEFSELAARGTDEIQKPTYLQFTNNPHS